MHACINRIKILISLVTFDTPKREKKMLLLTSSFLICNSNLTFPTLNYFDYLFLYISIDDIDRLIKGKGNFSELWDF